MKNPEQPKLAAVLLAAGGSSRLGQSKQLVEVDGVSLARRTAELLLGLEIVSLTVVTGCCSDEVLCEIESLAVDAVVNSGWRKGLGGSIAHGVRGIPGEVDGLMLMLCDQWRVDRTDLMRLVHLWQQDVSQVCVSSWRSGNALASGPPVIFPRHLIPKLKGLKNKDGAKPVIENYSRVKRVEIENAAFDLDTPEDLEALISRSAQPR
ncbi:MAG: nucleotidyltransferase family protein [Xanthomonadales bacterium]|nr:nucleotidyltransferase family protein [Gammaproteobacteria bacterium]MBT8054745.1 nucleotidyltransferase family protein [Gammaproteobacteria bacterium]NND58538.1 nucleotidyltransferase family protein [Xanthomonadales bacterium]NNK52232.1 nucleotidyltransferase family protein [Xanthomonadales bacterium]